MRMLGLLVGLLVGGGPCVALAGSVASVVDHDRLSEIRVIERSGERRACESLADVDRETERCPLNLVRTAMLGDELVAGEEGRLRVLLDSEGPDRRQFDLFKGTRARIIGTEQDPSLKLLVGDLYWMGDRGIIETPTGVVEGKNTAFLVEVDADGVARVTVSQGTVELHGHGVRERGSEEPRLELKPREIGLIGLDGIPVLVEQLAQRALERRLRKFEFIGHGRAQSQIIDSALLHGDFVLPPDRGLLLPANGSLESPWPEQPIEFELIVDF